MPRPMAAMFFNQPKVFTRYYWDNSSDQVSLRSDNKCAPLVCLQGLTKVICNDIRKNARPIEAFFSRNRNYFELVHDIIKTNVLTKFHED